VLKKIIVILSICSGLNATLLRIIAPNDINVAAGFTITESGMYVLSDNVYSSLITTRAIRINASNVTLDLNGKTLVGNPGGATRAISFGNTGGQNVTIKNGTLTNWPTAGIGEENVITRTGIFIENVTILGGGAAGSGISFSNTGLRQLSIKNCSVSQLSASAGISLAGPIDVTITNCTCEDNVGNGITVSGNNIRIKDSKFNKNGAIGLSCTVSTTGLFVENCTINGNTGVGVNLTSVLTGGALQSCSVVGNGGIGVSLTSNVYFGFLVRDCFSTRNTIGFRVGTPGATFLANVAYQNTTTNYGVMSDNAGLGFIEIENGGQIAPGQVLDPRIDNISIL
jgi:hypothetical protein